MYETAEKFYELAENTTFEQVVKIEMVTQGLTKKRNQTKYLEMIFSDIDKVDFKVKGMLWEVTTQEEAEFVEGSLVKLSGKGIIFNDELQVRILHIKKL